MARAVAAKKLEHKVPVVFKPVRKGRPRHWWNKKIKLWQLSCWH